MPSILHRGNGNFSAICSPLRYRKSRTPRKSVLPQHRPAVFYLIRKYQNSPRTGAGIGDAEQKCFCIEDISGKILCLLTLQRLPPSWLPVPWIADFYAFIIGGVFTVKLYIYIRAFALYIQFWRACIRRFHSLYFVYPIQGQIFCSVVPHLCYFAAFPLPFCVSVCGSGISLWPLCFFAPCFT